MRLKNMKLECFFAALLCLFTLVAEAKRIDVNEPRAGAEWFYGEKYKVSWNVYPQLQIAGNRIAIELRRSVDGSAPIVVMDNADSALTSITFTVPPNLPHGGGYNWNAIYYSGGNCLLACAHGQTQGRRVSHLRGAGFFILDPTIPYNWAIPINDLGNRKYRGFKGGLYGSGQNQPPEDHRAAGLSFASQVIPRNATGLPDPKGKYALLGIGMSNTHHEWCDNIDGTCKPESFGGQAAADSRVNHKTLVIVNGAGGHHECKFWADENSDAWTHIIPERLTAWNVTHSQVQVIWLKCANAGPKTSLPRKKPVADAFLYEKQVGQIVRIAKQKFPNLVQVFLSSRIYAGYGNEALTTLNPEIYAYEYGFGNQFVIIDQVKQMRTGKIDSRGGDLDYNTVAPWIAWGPYFWADGKNARSDGLVWLRADLLRDGTHPSASGKEKVVSMLMEFFLTSEFTPWFRSK